MSKVSVHRWLNRSRHSQRGSLLLETIILMSVFGLLGVAVLGAVQTSYFAKGRFDVQSTAENIARNQIDYVFEQDYLTPTEPEPGAPYLSLPRPDSDYLLPDGFSVEAKAVQYNPSNSNPNISRVQVRVFKDGQEVRVLETLRANLNPPQPGT